MVPGAPAAGAPVEPLQLLALVDKRRGQLGPVHDASARFVSQVRQATLLHPAPYGVVADAQQRGRIADLDLSNERHLRRTSSLSNRMRGSIEMPTPQMRSHGVMLAEIG